MQGVQDRKSVQRLLEWRPQPPQVSDFLFHFTLGLYLQPLLTMHPVLLSRRLSAPCKQPVRVF